MEKNFPSAKNFVTECLEKQITSPSMMARIFNEKYGLEGKPNARTPDAFTKALRRMGISAAQRLELKQEGMKEKVIRDITEVEQVRSYLTKNLAKLSKRHLGKVSRGLRRLWTYMGKTTPTFWTEIEIYEALNKNEPRNKEGKWLFPCRVYAMLSVFNTCFPNILTKGFTEGLTREAGELKDYLSFVEFDTFIANLTDTARMTATGWRALFKAQVNMGAREGIDKRTGILSLKWENINFETRRCRINEKGKRAVHRRLWQNVPLDFFEWLHGWDDLREWHRQRFGYYPTNERHASGHVFATFYKKYLYKFHATLKRCGGRLASDLETLTPHIMRKTHAQWCAKLRIPIQWVCGQFPDGWFGVGWDDPKVLLDYYMTLEDDERFEVQNKAHDIMNRLGLVLPSLHEEKQIR
jgi:integrase